METTKDRLLGGRFSVLQPAKGYRIAVDTLLLAAAVPIVSGQKGLDIGCGVGGVMLAVATRVKGVQLVGLEVQDEMAGLCQANIEDNELSDHLSVCCDDVVHFNEAFVGLFHQVMMNPPYHDGRKHIASSYLSKEISHMESCDADLEMWISRAANYLNDQGVLTLIHRADRLEEIVSLLETQFCSVQIKPVLARSDSPPKRVIIRASKSDSKSVQTSLPLVMYNDDGRYSAETEKILREAQPILF